MGNVKGFLNFFWEYLFSRETFRLHCPEPVRGSGQPGAMGFLEIAGGVCGGVCSGEDTEGTDPLQGECPTVNEDPEKEPLSG